MPDTIDRIYRYPVKSMAGEEIAATFITERGLLGDRAYALVDKALNRVAPTRSWATLLFRYRPEFVAEPELETPSPAVRIASPDGEQMQTADGSADRQLSAALGRDLTLIPSAPSGLLMEFPAGTLGGKMESATEAPLAGASPVGTFFDYACVHLITTGTLGGLSKLYPQGNFDVRRFRANFVVQSDGGPFSENSWLGRTLAIGDEVLLKVSIPVPRCVNTTLPQDGLPHDPGILRTLAQHNRCDLGDLGRLPCAGVYADVVRTGMVRCGDARTLYQLGKKGWWDQVSLSN